jgi:acetoin utilization deacetylase AcuC-like enzyme
MPLGLVRDPIYQQHDPGAYHPESPLRLKIADEFLANWPETEHLVEIEIRQAKHEELARVHGRTHIESVAAMDGRGGFFDADTCASPMSYQAALYAAGGLINLVDAALEGRVQNGLALVRPPGHHAMANQAMGFCLFNNVTVAAAHLLRARGLERVLIVDWDVHHGNGTESIFYNEPGVLYFSTHQSPFYPGTGPVEALGNGPGAGYNINVPLPPGQGDNDYIRIFEDLLTPIARQYAPEFILVSAGFDAHCEDILGSMEITDQGYGALSRVVNDLAAEFCPGRVVLTLEGGYCPEAQARSLIQCLAALNGNDQADELREKAKGTESSRFQRGAAIAASRYWQI